MVLKPVIEEADESVNELKDYVTSVFKQVRAMKCIVKIEGEKCMRCIDRKLCFSKKERGKVVKEYMEQIMDEEHG